MTNTQTESRRKASEEIKRQTAVYLASGKNIEYLPAPHCEVDKVRINPTERIFQ